MAYFGDYELLEKVGEGGMGVVYRARQLSLGRIVAVKFLARDLHADTKLRSRFQQEARLLARLEHPGIVPIYEVGEHDGRLYFSMEYVPGEDLARRTRERPLPARQAAAYVEAVADALDHAHRQGIIHRDLKPSNILVGADGRARVTDFGLARDLETAERLTLSGPVLGTPEYMAPEQASGRKDAATVRSDVYSLGAVLHHLLTGRPPFMGSTPLETVQLVQGTEPVSPRKLNPAIPRDLETITLRCLAKAPDRRYASAAAVAEDLARWREGRPILARPVSRVERAWMWAKRRPVVAGLAATCVVLMLATLMLLIRGLHQSRQAAMHAEAQRDLQRAITVMRTGNPHGQGWSQTAASLLRSAGRLESREDYQEQVTAWMEGMDARRIAGLRVSNIARLQFNPTGSVLRVRAAAAVMAWDYASGSSREPEAASLPGRTVAVLSGVPISVLATPEGSWVAYDEEQARVLSRLELPAGFDAGVVTGAVSAAAALDGSRIALHLTDTNGQPVLACWDLDTGQRAGWTHLEEAPTALALSPDGRFVAAGMTNGRVSIRDAAGGVRIEERGFSRLPITAVAFGPNRRRPGPPKESVAAWTLAAGDTGGRVMLRRAGEEAIEVGRGANYQVTQLLFSPDGTTLASAGRGYVRLWDVATGRPLLNVHPGDFQTALAFDADGRQLAVAADTWGTLNPVVTVWALEPGRGIATLRGLAGSVTKVAFSKDTRKLAALSMSWELGVWDRVSGRLEHQFEVAHGVLADNAALAFSPDGRRLAYSSGTAAQLWDTETGALVREWKLPLGFTDAMSYPSEAELYSVRREVWTGAGPMEVTAGQQIRGRVCPLRNLMTGQAGTVITNFHRLVGTGALADGHRFALEGFDGQGRYGVMVVDVRDGRVIWQTLGERHGDVSTLRVAGDGGWLSYSPDGTNSRVVNVDQPGVIWDLSGPGHTLGRDGRWHTRRREGPDRRFAGFSVVERERVLLNLDLYSDLDFFPEFDAAGELLAWGTRAGELKVCNVPELLRRLAAFVEGNEGERTGREMAHGPASAPVAGARR